MLPRDPEKAEEVSEQEFYRACYRQLARGTC